ncbi:MAG: glycerol-3-phosphate dehydrogenase/oxidase, partial [Promethearchaeota archaeon]
MKELESKIFNLSWNHTARNDIIEKLQSNYYDVIVIGGGVTGAGVAREAVMRELKVALVEMQDFAAGTSSRSSKLAHGGIRYLAHGEMDLVKTASTERNWMRHHCPTVRPIPFLFVEIEGGKYKKRDITGACKIYDYLSDNGQEFKNYMKHKWYSAEKIHEMEPEFIQEGVKGGAVYYDCNVDDARLTLEILKEAVVRGADIINYCKVMDYIIEDGKIIGVKCEDLENNMEVIIKGKLIVNATGIWTDKLLRNYPENIPKPLIRPTKGVHVQFLRKHVKNRMATIIRSITDDRSFFVLPRNEDFTIIGTTDTDYEGDLSSPFCTKEDADYLIKSVKYYFPNAELDYDNILSTYAGIRPLVMEKGKAESEVSRKHVIFFSDDGLLTIAGGKLTEWRAMAEDLFEDVEKKGIFPNIHREKGFSKQKFIIMLEKEDWLKALEKSGLQLDEKISNHLFQQYRRGALKILEIIQENPQLADRILDDYYFIKAEVVYTLRYELTLHLIDVFRRRTEMSIFIDHRKQEKVANIVADIMAEEYGWSEEKKNQEIN